MCKFKNKFYISVALITILVLSVIIISTCFNANMFTFAEEVDEELSQQEMELAFNNLYCKFDEEDKPVFKDAEVLYDFNDKPLYALYNFDNHYMIVIRETGTILERGEFTSKYEGMHGKKFYGQFFEAYQKIQGSVLDSNNHIINVEEQNAMKNYMQDIREKDYAEFMEAVSKPQPLGASNRGRLTMLGHSQTYYDYFAKELNIYYQSYNGSSNGYGSLEKNSVLYSVDNMTPVKYGLAYYRKFGNDYDIFYPKNLYNSCSIVTMTILLQYYDRMNIRNLIDPSISYTTTLSGIKSYPLSSKTEQINLKLFPLIYRLDGVGENLDGAATYFNINGAFDRYFANAGINCEPRYFTSYTNVKGAIDSGNPVIITVGAGRGFYKNNNSSTYNEVNLSGHNVVAYGYTKNSVGIMDEFVVHANWHNPTYNCGSIFMNKLYSAGNCYLQVL